MFQKSKKLFLFFGVMALVQLASSGVAFAVNNPPGGGTPPAAAGVPAGPGATCGGNTIGGIINCLRENTADSLISVFIAASYVMGLLLGVIAVVKLKDHVENPNNVPLSASMKRFIAGGAFFALPFVAGVIERTITGGNPSGYSSSGFNGQTTGIGLDAMIVAMMENVFVPLQLVFGAFGYVAGTLLVIIGISRLLKSEQDGPRGPAGIGTIMTFVIAGCLFSLNTMITHLSGTMLMSTTMKTNGVLQYTQGLGTSVDHVHAVISAIIAFGIVIGWVSLIRGFFIIRGVSEGNSQASMMAAITHLIGGVLAINLGSVIMAVQNTLGITQYGIIFN